MKLLFISMFKILISANNKTLTYLPSKLFQILLYIHSINVYLKIDINYIIQKLSSEHTKLKTVQLFTDMTVLTFY